MFNKLLSSKRMLTIICLEVYLVVEEVQLLRCLPLHRTSKQAVEEQKRAESELALDVESARVRITEIQQELETVVEQLGEAKVDKHESARAAKKAELIENLKRLFPGVVSCHCQLSCRLAVFFSENTVLWEEH